MLEVEASLAGWRARTERLRRDGASLGLTMTMGALHEGHVSLFERSNATCDVSLATIFVNPRQFGDPRDLAAYPRDLDADLAIAETSGVQLVLAPTVGEMWPSWPEPTATTVHVDGVTDGFEGEGRPGHFDGVASVVTKLLVATGSCTAFFGEKDYQQLCVVRRLVEDLSLGADVVGCPIVREADGLARSSRNVRLTPSGRRAALVLSRALERGRAVVEAGGGVDDVELEMRRTVADERLATLAYASAVEPETLRRPLQLPAGTPVRLLVAALVDGVRLIDNAGAVAGVP